MAVESLKIEVLLRNLASRGLSSIQRSFVALRKGTGALGTAMTSLQGRIAALGATLSAGLFIRATVKTFADFDDTMRAVGAVSGATADQFEELTKVAKEMGRTTKFTASEAADGLRFLSMAGLEAEESIAALPGTLELATAGNLDLGQAADITTNVLTGFGLEVDNLSRVNDVLTATFTSSNTNLIELGEGFKMVGPIAAGVGADFEDLVGTLGKLGDAGLKGTLAGTALRGAINALLNPTKEEMKLMKGLEERLGGVALKVKDASGNFIGFTSVITQLEEAGLRGDEALELFGLRAGPGMAALLGIGGDKLRDYIDGLRDVEGTSKRIADEMKAGLGGAIRELEAAWEGLKITIGEIFEKDLINAFRTARDWVNTLQSSITRWSKDNTFKEWMETIAEIGSWLSDVLKTIYHELDSISKLFFVGLAAANRDMKLAKMLFQDYIDANDDYLRSKGLLREAHVIEKEALDESIVAIQKQINLTKEKIETNKEDAKGWRAKILGAEAYENELKKNEDRLVSLQSEMDKLVSKKSVINVRINQEMVIDDIDESKIDSEIKPKLPDPGPIGRGEKEGGSAENKIIKEAVASSESVLRAQEAKLQAIIDKELAALETLYSQGLVDLNNYFNDRKALTSESIEAEIELQEALLKLEDNPDKKLAINAKIFALEQEHQSALLKLTEDRFEAEKSLEEDKLQEIQKLKDQELAINRVFADSKARIDAMAGTGLDSRFAKEISDLQERQNRELQVLKDNKAKEGQINDLARQHEIEKVRLHENQVRDLMDYRLESAAQMAGGMAQIFDDLYKLSGEKNKTYFRLAKAASIAEATMNIAQGITKAWAEGGTYGAVGAAIVAAAGAVQLATIMSQGFASGGEIPGHSPTKKSDNILARVTAGEFVQPVDSVDYYGTNIMEAIRRRTIPKEVFSGFQIPSIPRMGAHSFAEGGSVSSNPNEMINVVINQGQQKESAHSSRDSNGALELIINLTASNIANDGKIGKTIQTKFGLSPQGRRA